MVWFSGILYYKIDSGYGTNETTGLRYLFQLNSGGNSIWASHVATASNLGNVIIDCSGTKETTGLYYFFQLNKGDNYPMAAHGATESNPIVLSDTCFDKIMEILIAQSKYINAIHKVSKINGLKWEI